MVTKAKPRRRPRDIPIVEDVPRVHKMPGGKRGASSAAGLDALAPPALALPAPLRAPTPKASKNTLGALNTSYHRFPENRRKPPPRAPHIYGEDTRDMMRYAQMAYDEQALLEHNFLVGKFKPTRRPGVAGRVLGDTEESPIAANYYTKAVRTNPANRAKETVVVTFRGTTPASDWQSNLDSRLVRASGVGERGYLNHEVHGGFRQRWKDAAPAFYDLLGQVKEDWKAKHGNEPMPEIRLVGHSLGGAMAQMAFLDMQSRPEWKSTKIRTFAVDAPPIGSKSLEKYFQPGYHFNFTRADSPVGPVGRFKDIYQKLGLHGPAQEVPIIYDAQKLKNRARDVALARAKAKGSYKSVQRSWRKPDTVSDNLTSSAWAAASGDVVGVGTSLGLAGAQMAADYLLPGSGMAVSAVGGPILQRVAGMDFGRVSTAKGAKAKVTGIAHEFSKKDIAAMQEGIVHEFRDAHDIGEMILDLDGSRLGAVLTKELRREVSDLSDAGFSNASVSPPSSAQGTHKTRKMGMSVDVGQALNRLYQGPYKANNLDVTDWKQVPFRARHHIPVPPEGSATLPSKLGRSTGSSSASRRSTRRPVTPVASNLGGDGSRLTAGDLTYFPASIDYIWSSSEQRPSPTGSGHSVFRDAESGQDSPTFDARTLG